MDSERQKLVAHLAHVLQNTNVFSTDYKASLALNVLFQLLNESNPPAEESKIALVTERTGDATL